MSSGFRAETEADGNVRRKARADYDAIRNFIARQIEAGTLKPGDRLPTERELVDSFGAARNTVRRTLDELARHGRIVRQVGRGTFVADGEGDALPAASEGAEIRFLDSSPADVIECRLMFEPGMAELAVARATQADFERMEECLRRADAAEDWRAFEHWDEKLHRTIAEATRNPAVLSMNDALALVRRQGEWGKLKQRSLTPARRAALQQDHYAIVRALRERDVEEAREAMRRHLLHVRGFMFQGNGLVEELPARSNR